MNRADFLLRLRLNYTRSEIKILEVCVKMLKLFKQYFTTAFGPDENFLLHDTYYM
jgi:hypothetical protein